MGVSKNNGTPKSSILIGFSIINHPFWGTPIFGNTHISRVISPSVKPMDFSAIFDWGFALVPAWAGTGSGRPDFQLVRPSYMQAAETR